MSQSKLLAALALMAILFACTGTGKQVIASGDDATTPADSVSGDAVVGEDGSLTDGSIPPPEDVLHEGGPGCVDACAGKVCGEFDDCNCGSCTPPSFCSADGTICEGDADIGDPCPSVCEGVECGQIEGCDCGGCEGGWDCAENECISDCAPECVNPETGEDYECGSDGCDGDCGSCGADEWCDDHVCNHDDPPDCEAVCDDEGFDCGDVLDGQCDCGDCEDGYACAENVCEALPPDCVEVCGDKECGDVDGCDCGTCSDGDSCTDEFVCACAPVCGDKECGEDGCGGICGFCDYGTCENGTCNCTANCAGKECGSDGCGGSCGDCGNEVCAWNGQCYASCTPGVVEFSETVQKLVTMQMGADGMDGEALDIDGNPATCSPFGKCENGNDNSLSNLFSSIADFIDINASLTTAVDNGTVIMVAELVGFVQTGLPFSLNMYIAEPSVPKGQCNFQTTTCNYVVDSGAIDWEACAPMVTFDNATVVDGLLTSGGNGYQFTLPLPFFGGQPLLLLLHNARIHATIDIDANGKMTLSNGVIGGAIDKQLLLDAVDEMPDDGGLPVSKDMIKNLLNMLINNDVDTTGDGKKDKASMGIKFTSIPGAIVGVM